MDMNKEDFDISRLKYFLWDSPKRIHNLIVTTLAILTLGLAITIGFSIAQPQGFVQSFSETFSDIMGPVVGGVAAVFALLAFYVQYKSNEQTKQQFKANQVDFLFNRYMDDYHRRLDGFSIHGNFLGEEAIEKWYSEFFDFYRLADVVFDVEDIGNDYRYSVEFRESFLIAYSSTFFFLNIIDYQLRAPMIDRPFSNEVFYRLRSKFDSFARAMKDMSEQNHQGLSIGHKIPMGLGEINTFSFVSDHHFLVDDRLKLSNLFELIKAMLDTIHVSETSEFSSFEIYCNLLRVAVTYKIEGLFFYYNRLGPEGDKYVELYRKYIRER